MFVYLDLKDWIEVARDFYKRENGQGYPDELERILNSVATGEVCFPLVDTLFLEFIKNSNPTRRARLARIMSVLSLGYVIADKRTRLVNEIRLALAKMLKQSTPLLKDVLVRGFPRALISDDSFARLAGLNPNKITQVIQATDSIEAWVDYFLSINEETRKFLLHKFQDSNKRQIEMLEHLRKTNSNFSELLRAYYARLFLDTQTTILQVLAEFGLSHNELLNIDAVAFSSEIPSFEIEAKLALESMKQRSRRLAENDCYDISSLAGALPYCSAIVTEAFWVDLCQRLGFDTKYGCKLYTNYKEVLPTNQAEK